jgi:hypothetical protein
MLKQFHLMKSDGDNRYIIVLTFDFPFVNRDVLFFFVIDVSRERASNEEHPDVILPFIPPLFLYHLPSSCPLLVKHGPIGFHCSVLQHHLC